MTTMTTMSYSISLHGEMLMTSSNFFLRSINGPWELKHCGIRPGRQLQFLSSGRKVKLLLRL